MKVSEQIRRAALGPLPRDPIVLAGWFGGWVNPDQFYVIDLFRFGGTEAEQAIMGGMSNNERRMFLLFVSYAIESEGE